jgi:hypothetical protein
LTATLVPAQILTGRVTYADTGKGVPHAPLGVMSGQGRIGILSDFETDAEGRFRVNPPPADRSFNVTAFPPQGQPYLIATNRLEWPKGAIEQSLDLALPRGALIRGKVTEEGSGKPVSGATVDFTARAEQQNRQGRVPVNTASDGSFQLGAEPGPGYLFIRGPSEDFVLAEIGNRALLQGQPGGTRIYSHAHIGLDLKPGIDTKEIHLTLRRGVTVKGQLVGPDGQPVRDAWIFSRIVLDPRQGASRSWNGAIQRKVRNGRFELHGLDPDVETPVYFIDPKHKLGAIVNLSGKSIALMTIANRTGRVAVGATIAFSDESEARGPITVRLEPCGAAKARVVDPEGKPLAGRLPRDIIISMVVTPGPPRGRAAEQAGLLFAEEADLTRVDSINYERELVCNTEGRLTLPVLIPGATYRFIDYTAGREAVPQVRKEFTVKPGETIDLGDVLVEKPRG